MRYVTLGEGLEHIDEEAFSGCKSLREITLPSSVEYIAFDAFNRCKALKKIYISNEEQGSELYFDNKYDDDREIINGDKLCLPEEYYTDEDEY